MKKTVYGPYIQQKREALGITREELSQNLGITPSMLTKIENGKEEVSLPMLVPICFTLKMTINSFLLGRDDNRGPLANFNPFSGTELARSISFLRVKGRLSIEEMSKQTGFPKKMIESFESGQTTPTLSEFQRLADYFRIEYDDFYFGNMPLEIVGSHVLETQELLSPYHRKKKHTGRNIFLTILILLVLAAAGFAAYYFFFRK